MDFDRHQDNENASAPTDHSGEHEHDNVEVAQQHEVEQQEEVAQQHVAQQHEIPAENLGIAAVLFPATPPVPKNARFIRGSSFHDYEVKRTSGLASAAGFLPAWTELHDDRRATLDS